MPEPNEVVERLGVVMKTFRQSTRDRVRICRQDQISSNDVWLLRPLH